MGLISVIVCTYNRRESLKETLNSLLAQEINGSFNYEILVIDNNSKDKTKEAVGSYFLKFGGKLKYLFESRQGKSYALNTALKEANGEIIAFCDDDVIVDPNWLLSIAKCFNEFGCDAMGGRVLPLYPKNVPSWVKENKDLLVGPVVRHDYGEEVKIYDSSLMRAFIGSNMAVKSSYFSKIGLFRTDLGPGQGQTGEDTDIFNRLKAAGAKLYYNGPALVLHPISKERITYRFLVKYYFVLGKYYTKKDYEMLAKDNPVCYFGIPRYFLKTALVNLLKIVCFIGNTTRCLPYLINMSVAIGEGVEFRKTKQKENMSKNNILFIDSGGGRGGSMSYLYSFLKYMDREKYNPSVAMYYNSTAETLKAIRHMGIKVVFIMNKERPKEREENKSIKYGYALNKIAVYFRFVFEIIKNDLPAIINLLILMRKQRIKAVIFGSDVEYNLSGILAAKLAGVKCIVRKSGIGDMEYRNISRVLSRFVDLFIASSDAELARHSSNKLPYKEIVKVYEGVDINYYLPGKASGKIRREFSIGADQKIAGIISRIDIGKGHSDVLRAASEVVKKVPDTIFLIVGDDFDRENSSLKVKLKNEAAVLGLDKNVIFAGWREDTLDILREIDIFVHCPNAWKEGMGIATLEALACGKPVVITDNWGLAETTIDGYNGFVVPIGDCHKIAEKIMTLCQDDALRTQMGLNARAYAVKMFEIQKNVKQTEEMINKQLNIK